VNLRPVRKILLKKASENRAFGASDMGNQVIGETVGLRTLAFTSTMPGLAQLLFSLLVGSTLLTVVIEGVLCLAGAHGRIPYQDPAFRLAVLICIVLVLNIRFTYILLFTKQHKPRFSFVLALSSNVLAVGAYGYLLCYNIRGCCKRRLGSNKGD
jgi:hypothetical protein